MAELLGVALSTTVKSLVLATDQVDEHGQVKATQVWLLLLRGDHDMNEVKVGKLPGMEGGFRFATQAEIEVHFGCKPGYLGPVNLKKPLKVVADRDVALMADWICGANEVDFHMTGVNWGRDLPEPDLVADIRNVVAGDKSPDGRGELAIERGIEIGRLSPDLRRYDLDAFPGDDPDNRHRDLAIPITSLDAGLVFEREWDLFGTRFTIGLALAAAWLLQWDRAQKKSRLLPQR